jgi:hypothetical protein
MFLVKVISITVLAAAAAISSFDVAPKNKLRLKDLDAPPEDWAAHSDVWKLIMSTKI